MSTLFDELKRRNVIRVAVAYVVTAWLILQVADVVIGNIGAPGWVFSVFLLALGLLFVPVIFFSWAYELTPEGLKRESDVDRSRSITPQTGRKLDTITIVTLVAVVAFVLVEGRLFGTQPEALTEPRPVADSPLADSSEKPAPSEVTATAVDDNSIAVLAFEDLSQERDQAFFAEGLSEELLNVLAQVPGLKVAGRTSSFAFRGKDADIREIGDVLNVAHVLEGSVRKAGNRIRVTAQLIKASDGFHVFSETYDRDLDDIFGVQDELADLIGSALLENMPGSVDVPSVTPTSLEAYDLYLLARQRIRSRNPGLMSEAASLLDEALTIDPDYAPALAQRALAEFLLSDAVGAYGDIPEKQAIAMGRELLERALAIDPELAEGWAVLGLVTGNDIARQDEAKAHLRRALTINPNLEAAKLWLANTLVTREESEALYEEIVFRDPMFGPAFNNLIQIYAGTSEFDKADTLIDRVERIAGETNDVHLSRGTISFVRGDLADAERDLRVAFEANPNATVTQLWRCYTLLQLGDPEGVLATGCPTVRILAIGLLGEYEEAERLIADMDLRSGDGQRAFRHIADYYSTTGQPGKVIELVDREFGGVDGLLAAYSTEGSWGAEHLAVTAHVYLEAGRDEEFRKLLAKLRATLDFAKDFGYDNSYYWFSEVQYAALTGNADAANRDMQRALDRGLVSVVVRSPAVTLLADNVTFQGMVAEVIDRGNAERAKLGWEPYRPINPTN